MISLFILEQNLSLSCKKIPDFILYFFFILKRRLNSLLLEDQQVVF